MKPGKPLASPFFLISCILILAIYYYVFNLRYLNNETSDILNYFAARNYYLYLAEELDGVWSFVTRSGVFWLSYSMLGQLIEDDAHLLFLISGMALLITYHFLYTENRFLCLINTLILLHPRVLDLLLSQQRNALALAIFLMALGRNNKFSRALLCLVALSIHSSIIILLGVSILHTLARRQDIRFLLTSELAFGGKKIPDSLYAFSWVVLAFMLFSLIYALLRQQGSINTYGHLGTLEITMWLVTLSPVLIFSSKQLIEKQSFIFLFVFLLAITSPLTGIYGPRLLSISLIFLAMLLQKTARGTTSAFALILSANMLVSYLYWL